MRRTDPLHDDGFDWFLLDDNNRNFFLFVVFLGLLCKREAVSAKSCAIFNEVIFKESDHHDFVVIK